MRYCLHEIKQLGTRKYELNKTN